jgi:tyrosyl-tRNA synthetase
LGGSDQWGNIVNGIDLGRRMDGAELYGVTTPLLTTADGAKMGKTAAGAVWLNEVALPGYDFWQYWRNVDDRDVGRFLRLFTDMPLAEITRLEKLEGSEVNAAKVMLANAVTTLVRGSDAAKAAELTATATFAGGGMGADLPELAIPAEGMTLAAACTATGFTSSNGEAKRKVAEGAVRLDDQPVLDAAQLIRLDAGQSIKLSLGKKKHAILRSS